MNHSPDILFKNEAFICNVLTLFSFRFIIFIRFALRHIDSIEHNEQCFRRKTDWFQRLSNYGRMVFVYPRWLLCILS